MGFPSPEVGVVGGGRMARGTDFHDRASYKPLSLNSILKTSQAAVRSRSFVRKVDSCAPSLSTALPPPGLAPIHSWVPLAGGLRGSPNSPLSLWKESRPHAHKPPLYENLRQQPQHFKKGAPQTGLPCTMKLSGIVAEVFFFLAMYACELLSVGALDSACQSPLLGPRSKPGGGFKLSMLEEPCT